VSELLLSRGVDAHLQSCPVFSFELNNAVDQRKQRVIRTLLDIAAGMEFGPSLPDKDVAGFYKLASEPFYAETL
jgi:hypothetical protein